MSSLFRTAAWVAPAMAMIAAPALADAVRLAISESEDGARIEARWAEGQGRSPPELEASISSGVLRLRFSEPVEVDVAGLQAAAPRTVSFAQSDGRDVRIALRRTLDAHVGESGGVRVVQLGPPGAPQNLRPPAETAPPPSNVANLAVGLREDFTRLSFRWPAATTVLPRQNGDQLELRFNRASTLDLAEFRAAPPRFVRDARLLSRPGQNVRVMLTLEPGVRQRHFVDGNYTVVDLLPSLAAPDTPQEADAARADTYRPPSGPSGFRVTEDAEATRISVDFPIAARAAAFRRGEAIWLLFDSGGRINLANVARAGRRHRDMIAVSEGGMIGVRIPAPPDVLVSAHADGTNWTFTLSTRQTQPINGVPVRRDVALANLGRLTADFGAAGSVKWLLDPEIGDRLGVALLSGDARGVAQRRATLEAALLPTAHGALIEPRADGVNAAFDRGSLIVSRGQGLIAQHARTPISDNSQNTVDIEALDLQDGGAAPSADVRRHLDALERAAAEEGMGEGAAVDARMALARFLVANELAAEALGALRIAAYNQPETEIDPEFRLLRASANLMMGRTAAAQGDLSASSLMGDPKAALWRGYSAARDERWEEARRELEAGLSAEEEYSPEWRSRFALARAEAALALGDVAAAEIAARAAQGQAASTGARLRGSLVLARAAAARGDETAAVAIYTELARARDEEVAVRAGLEVVRLRRGRGQIEAREAADLLEAMRFRWRGDALEIDVVATLGDVYMEMGRWREALEVMQVAADRYPGNVAGRRLRADMTAAFERLFLDGEADSLEPIQAVGLFYQFIDLTPVGPNGDRIVRLLAGRLVQVDLLEQAAQLLQHQVDERLEGLGRAQVAAELAAIYLMDRRADQAFQTISLTRAANIPASLLSERRVLEARALMDMGRLEHALELVERDQSADAQRVRAEAAWRARDWERASAELQRLVAQRNRATPLDADGRLIVLRAAIAMTMAGQDAAVRALYRDHAGDMAGTPDADAFDVVASGMEVDGVAMRDLARAVSRTDLLERFLQGIRARMVAEAPQRAPRAPAAPETPPRDVASAPPQRQNPAPARAPAA